MTWNVAAQWTATVKRNTNFNITYRQVIEPSAISLSGNKLRITLQSAAGSRLAIADCFIGKTAAGGVKPSFAVNPVRVTFGGDNGVVILEGATVVSDEITFDYDPAGGQALTVSFFIPTPALSGIDILGTVGRSGVTGVNLYYLTGNKAGANSSQVSAADFVKDSKFDVLSVVKIEVEAPVSGGAITSSLFANWNVLSSAAASGDVSKASIYAISEYKDRTDISKFSIYGIVDAGNIARLTKASMYVIVTEDVISVLTAKWNIEGLETLSNIQFKWNIENPAITSDLTVLWNVTEAVLPFIRTLQLRWNVNGPITSEIRFRWNDLDGTPAIRSCRFRWNDYADVAPIDYILSGLSISWNLGQGYVDPSRVIYPDVPILETWTFKTAVFRSRSGKEQRRSYFANPVVTQQYSALILDDKGFQDLRQAVEIDTTAFYQVPMFQYYDYLKRDVGALDTRLYFDPREVNPIVDNYLAICDHDTGVTSFHVIEELHADGCTIKGPVGRELMADVQFVCPVRVSRISTDGNAKLYPVHANATYIFVSVDRDRPFLRPGVSPDFTMLGGYIVLDIPISADTDINEDYLSGNEVIDNGQALPLLFVDEPTRRRFDLVYRMNRLDGPEALDWWRSFALAVCGQWKAFLLPTYRADAVLAVPAGPGDTEIEVLGRATYDVFTAGGYFGIMYDTLTGREYREVTGVTLDGSNTVCLLAEPIGSDVGDNDFEDVSYLMRVRLSEDQISINHGKMARIVQLKVQMTSE